MFCKNCGNQVEDQAVVCVHCGVGAGTGTNFCPNCDAGTAPGQVVCTNCGIALTPVDQKSKMTAGLLGIFLGAWGVHNFFLGNTNRGILQIILTVVTCGAAGLWGFIEGIMILTGNIKTDANGVPLKD